MRIFAAVLIVLVATLFALEAASGPSDNPDPRDLVREAQTCQATGGTWRRICLRGTWSCVTNHPDGGKECSDGDECAGDCRYQGKDVQPGVPVKGVCQQTSDPCGCFTLVEDGKADVAMCVD